MPGKVKIDFKDTIAAISTAQGQAGIGIVRLSGDHALEIAGRIFQGKDGSAPQQMESYSLRYGWVKNKAGAVVDEVLLSVMRAPRSYTKEDIVEINCHGGIIPLRKILDLVLENGARMAEPGEFTRRAFLNGRIDLAQAEAVSDIISAKTDSALKISLEQLKGALSQKIRKIRRGLLDVLAVLEANIDFPDEEIGALDRAALNKKLDKSRRELRDILDSSRTGRVLREGIHVVICGRPNAGKSSLLNALLKQERSIVTPIAGTTRDTIEEIIDIQGIPVRIVDTAGIIEPRDLIEKKAVERAKKQIKLADLVILVFDGSRKLGSEDAALMRNLAGRPLIALINKIDLKQRIEKEKLKKHFHSLVEISAKNAKNVRLLEDALVHAVYNGRVTTPESVLVSNARHIEKLKHAEKFIADSLVSLDNSLSSEFVAEALKEALGCLDDILGKKFSEDLLDKIFSEFCIGK
ncbi:MAG: tRNA uridine-5-carboxymethylaminomethyl(34) synthesis GTPase MnmE [Candidatus Omnitrophica bacterium]|nr:tRNA uridine-5-carboxymethylaminomethyl(34) synthesis GTPase MnmE [Candidatus Omnitrophota bacterium]MDD5611228.1 tRNA uridine-5-carboxymethylaminomethyl(34) synthesis GTPase MnmE [Candidatus Omnitrophota bacterium]